MLESAGFEVFDLGRDIPPIRFVEKAEEVNAKIIALSTLMTTTMDGMAEVINILNRQKIRDRYKVMVGGGPISQRFADKIGADGYSANAAEAVRLARRLVGVLTVLRDQMTPKERMEAYNKGQPIDRLPCVPIVGNTAARVINVKVSEFKGNGKLLAKAHVAAYRMFGYDIIRVFTDLYVQAEQWGQSALSL